ncbi:MAG: bifunctional oligoribonuclease/PAP phosphatase NrnA [Verrucomicrobia bacterium]|jgi:phosphoesterase RecJ-like protein|nr:bifunctional oligoribonuclease/PAP phosphatase NrnA [Verrucomicrobiota bacterium]|tara:strand:+ start:2609 stop:3604 length:996 start_codon:yes stop_codon:yes gene_type:complete
MDKKNLHKCIAEVGEVIADHERFVIMSHVRPDGDAIGSQVAFGFSLMAMGKTVFLVNEDGVPESLEFLKGAGAVSTPPIEPLDIEVAIALDTATKPRLGDGALHAASKAKVWLNIDHHISNPAYGDINLIDATKPATGQIVYEIIKALDYPLPEETRDAIYVAVSTDTGSFQYGSTTAETYDMGADLIRRGLDVGKINADTYDNHPYRRLELMRALLNSLEISEDGRLAHWELLGKTCEELSLQPDDSEGLIDLIRGVKGVLVAAFFEELEGGKIRVSMRSKDKGVNVCDVATQFGGGGHALAAGIRMAGPIADAKNKVLAALESTLGQAN